MREGVVDQDVEDLTEGARREAYGPGTRLTGRDDGAVGGLNPAGRPFASEAGGENRTLV